MEKLNSFKLTGLIVGFLLISAQVNAQLARGVRLIEVLASENQVVNFLVRNGIDQAPAQSVRDSVALSWRSLIGGQELPSPNQLQSIIRNLNVTDPSDIRVKAELEQLLNRPIDQVSRQDMVTAINNLIYMANRHGSGDALVMACSSCVSSNLSRNGFRFTLQSVDNANAQYVLSNILPSNPQALRSYIGTRMRAMNLGDYSRVPVNLVSPEEERTLALFLGLADHGSAKQRELIDAVLQISRTPDGEIILLNQRNPHRLWALLADDLDDVMMDNWIRTLRQVADDAPNDVHKKDAFFAYLHRQYGDNVVSREEINMLRAQRCFFR